MKKIIFALTLSAGLNFSYAQEEMSPVWVVKAEHKVEFASGKSDRLNLSYGGSEKELTMVNNENGALKWKSEFKAIVPAFKKVDEIIPMYDAKVMFLFDRKMGKDQMAIVDLESGKLLWNTDKYQNITDENVVYIPEMEAFALSLKESLVMVKARTGEEIWQTTKFKGVVGAYMYMNDGTLVMLNYKPTALASLFAGFKNQIVKINTKNGDVIWDQTYIGAVQKKVFTREPVVKMNLEQGKIFLVLNGLQVYDFETGAKLWEAAYDISLEEVVKPRLGAGEVAVRWGVYEAIADPVVVGNDVYLIDMKSKSSQYVKKYDLNTGKLIWTSPELKGVKVAPGLYVQGDKVVIQIGGIVETQAYVKKTVRNSDGSTSITYGYRVDNPNIKPYGLECFDANTGTAVWRSERFKKGVTNAFVKEDKVYVCSGKAIYSLALADGKELYEVVLSSDGIGLANRIIDFKDNIIIICDKGVSSHKKSDGSLIASSKYKKSTFRQRSENTILLQTEADDIACFDMETCKYKKYNARPNATAMVSDDGKYVYVFEKKSISKLATR